jgi:hypothetical protein
VSEDVKGLFNSWAACESYVPVSEHYFSEFSAELCKELQETTGAPVEMVTASELEDGLQSCLATSTNPVISLDRAYLNGDFPQLLAHIDMTRAVDESFVDKGILPRPGFDPVDIQVETLRSPYESPIELVDDVVFTGEGIVDLCGKLRRVNRPVSRVIAGIGIGGGLKRLGDEGIDVECVRVYEDVLDEVCERDFLAGVPMSGRTVVTDNGQHWSAPYFEPFGDPSKWASIPRNAAKRFSQFCLDQSIELWGELEEVSNEVIVASSIPRRIQLIDGPESVVDALKKVSLLKEALEEV